MKLVKKIAIVCEDGRHRETILKQVGARIHFEILNFKDADELLNYKYLKSVRGIIFAIEKFGAEHLDMLIHFNLATKNIPIVLVSKNISNHFRSLFGLLQTDRCLVIEEKYELVDLNIILDRLTRGEKLVNREYCRYPVDVRIKVRRRNGSYLSAKVVNLSLGGAQLKVSAVSLKSGDELLLEFHGHPDIKGRVTWLNRHRGLIGVQFIKLESRKDRGYKGA